MKVRAGAYPEEKNWQLYLYFQYGTDDVSEVFLWRYAAYIRDYYGKKASVIGTRSYTNQQALYEAWIKYKAWLDAGKKGPKPPVANEAAKPGHSWHNLYCAIDANNIGTNTFGKKIYPATLESDFNLWSAGKPEILNKYGLCHAVKNEVWHVQPIETKGYAGERAWFLDADDRINTKTGYPLLVVTSPNMTGKFVELFQREVNKYIAKPIPVDGAYGAKESEPAAREFQTFKKLVVDGKCGDGTWTELIKGMKTKDELLIEDFKNQINGLTNQVSQLKAEKAIITQKMQVVQAERDSLNSKVINLTAEVANYKSKVVILEDNLKKKESLADDLTEKNYSLINANSAKEQEITRLGGVIQTLDNKIKSIKNALDVLKNF